MTSLVRTTLLVALGAALSSLAAAQSGGIRVTPGVPVAPLILEGEVVLTQRPIPPLDPEQLEQLRVAQSQRSSGLLDKAHATVTALLATVPHHPLALNELSRSRSHVRTGPRSNASGVRARRARRDSLLLGRDLVLALERMGREGRRPGRARVLDRAHDRIRWAFSTIARLAVGEPKGVRDAMHRVAASYPDRVDLQRGAIRLDWKMGDDRGAMRAARHRSAQHHAAAPVDVRRRAAARPVEPRLERRRRIVAEHVRRRATTRRTGCSPPAARGTSSASPGRRPGAGALYDALRISRARAGTGTCSSRIARGAARSGRTADARALLETDGLQGAQQTQVTLERALADLRDGPPARACPR